MIPSDDLEKYLVDLNDHGGPTFPVLVPENVEGFVSLGMSLRDYFAAQALLGIIAHPDGGGSFDSLAGYAYKYADAMLKAREVKHV
jgi:hypothetical protein